MKPLLILFVSSIIICAAYMHISFNAVSPKEKTIDIAAIKKQNPVSCSPDLSSFNFNDSLKGIPLLQGWGIYTMPVTVSDDSARIYFEQGINMYYGFHIIEALASFEKAVKIDSNFAMGYWGKALAYGPNINDFGYSASPDALASIHKAEVLGTNCTAAEKGLIDAMKVRYSSDTTQSREHLNQLYADAMMKLHKDFEKDPDVATLYVDALMVQHPWDLYFKNYQAKPWTAEIVNTLEHILKQFPDHPGASHYYIHAVEASATPERGMAVSKKLSSLMPGVAHIVHMPSHIFIRSGYYGDGEKVNDKAVKEYYNYLNKFPAVSGNSALYLMHNLHMQATCANMDGTFKKAMKSSVDCSKSFDTSWQSMPDYPGMFAQYIYMTPYLTLIRFGKWNDILKYPQVEKRHVYENLLWHYGRGLAFARKHDLLSSRKELDSLQGLITNKQLRAPAPSYANPAIAGAEVAEKILQGTIAEEDQHFEKAIKYLQQGKALEDSMVYNEPKDWVHPVRQYLGNVLLKAKKYAQAEAEFREDLVINPNNGWSLTGLAKALSGQHKNKPALEVSQRAAKAFRNSDLKIRSSVL